ncbi:MAG: hypothetical protein U0X87_10790 [Anaerolineales bacterium]
MPANPVIAAQPGIGGEVGIMLSVWSSSTRSMRQGDDAGAHEVQDLAMGTRNNRVFIIIIT